MVLRWKSQIRLAPELAEAARLCEPAHLEIVQLEVAQQHLAELVEGVARGQEIVIAKGDHAVAKLVSPDQPPQKTRFGSARGKIAFAPDWDEPIPGFGEFQ